MAATVEFYLARANESAQEAARTNLANVRERCLRSQAAWQNMADRLIHVEKQKQQDAHEKAARLTNQPRDMSWPTTPSMRRPKASE